MNFIKNFLKKYSALLLPAILVLISLLLLVPNTMIAKSLASDMQTSEQQQGQIRQLLNSASTKADAQAQKAYAQKRQEEKKTIEQKVVQASRRELIMYDFFPKPTDPSFQVYSDFGIEYRKNIMNLIEKIRARDAPTSAEIQQETGVSATSSTVGGGYDEMGDFSASRTRTQTKNNDPIVNALCAKRASQIPVYAHPDIFAWYSYWEEYEYSGGKQAMIDSWYSQVAFWIYNDVIDTIEALNSGSNQVNTSAVKRLLGIRFQGKVDVALNSQRTHTSSMYSGRGSQTTDIPVLVTETNPGPFLPFSWTERKSNTELDVIHFAVSVILDSRQLMNFYDELCSKKSHKYRPNHDIRAEFAEAEHNQITILESTAQAIERSDPIHELYRYGDASVMRVDLVCEYLFSREGFEKKSKENNEEITGTIKPAPIVELESGGEGSGSSSGFDSEMYGEY